MLVFRVAEFQMLGTWFLAVWQQLVLLFGWDRPPGVRVACRRGAAG